MIEVEDIWTYINCTIGVFSDENTRAVWSWPRNTREIYRPQVWLRTSLAKAIISMKKGENLHFPKQTTSEEKLKREGDIRRNVTAYSTLLINNYKTLLNHNRENIHFIEEERGRQPLNQGKEVHISCGGTNWLSAAWCAHCCWGLQKTRKVNNINGIMKFLSFIQILHSRQLPHTSFYFILNWLFLRQSREQTHIHSFSLSLSDYGVILGYILTVICAFS